MVAVVVEGSLMVVVEEEVGSQMEVGEGEEGSRVLEEMAVVGSLREEGEGVVGIQMVAEVAEVGIHLEVAATEAQLQHSMPG